MPIGSYYGKIVIPENVEYEDKTYSVTSIGSSAFKNSSDLVSVEIPNSVTEIGSSAFYNCGLTSVEIPNSVTEIGSSAFAYCENLESVVIPNSITVIRSDSFEHSGLISVVIPASVDTIEYGAFNECDSLTNVYVADSKNTLLLSDNSPFHNKPPFLGSSITDLYIGRYVYSDGAGSFGIDIQNLTIGNSVTKIGGSLCWRCYNLESVVIPNSVTEIEVWAFRQCRNLKSLIIGNSVTKIGDGAFSGCHGLTSVVIPNSVTKIEMEAFRACINLESLTIGEAVDSIGSNAFLNVSLKEIYCKAVNPPKLESQFLYTRSILYVPIGSLSAYKNAYGWREFFDIRETDFSGVDYIIADNEADGLNIALRENPAAGTAWVKVIGSDAETVRCDIHSLNGSRLMSTLLVANGTWQPVELHVPAGVYLLTVSDSHDRKTARLIVR